MIIFFIDGNGPHIWRMYTAFYTRLFIASKNIHACIYQIEVYTYFFRIAAVSLEKHKYPAML